VMTTRVVALRESADFKEIVCTLRRFRVSACPVLDEADRVIGVVSEADLLFKEIGPRMGRLSEQAKAAAVTAYQLMTAPAVVTRPEASVADAARLMHDKQVKRLPVLGRDGKLVGIVTRSDVLSVYERPDAEILDEVIKGIIFQEFALDAERLDVSVRSGIVTISGVVDRRDAALALLARVAHAEGVVAVRDRMKYPPAD
jgi:CBS domain-containing protein